MKNIKRYLLILISVMFVVNSVTVYAEEINEEIQLPNIVSEYAILMDAKTGRVLYGKNENEEASMASTTKIMTLIIALENANKEDIVVVGKNATKAPKVKMNLREGEEIRLLDLMYALMLESSNDAAVAIAEHVGGDVETFCNMMTEKAKDIGAVNTSFKTPNGLDAEGHYSTAYDMALITRYALANEDFINITNTLSVDFRSNVTDYHFDNKNRLLTTYEGANGVKTGFTNKAGQCFVGSAKRDDMQLISVVLASGWNDSGKEQKWIDTKRLLDFGFDNYKYETILQGKNIVGTVNVYNSKTTSIDVYIDDEFVYPINEKEKGELKLETVYFKNLNAPIVKDSKVGTATVYLGNEKIYSTDIKTYDDAVLHTFKNSVDRVIRDWFEL